MTQKYQATIVPYKVRMYDNLPRIAERELGDAAKWHDIAEYNKLDPPFIVNYKTVQGSKKATGIATIYVDSVPADVIEIPAGTIVSTAVKEYFGTIDPYTGKYITYSLEYTMLETVELTPEIFSVDAEVQAVEEGYQYNIFAGQLAVIKDFSSPHGDPLVRNKKSFYTADVKRIVGPGDIIFLPIGLEGGGDTFRVLTDNVTNLKDWSQRILGKDIVLISNTVLFKVRKLGQIQNDFVADKGDLAVHDGTNNLAQATTHRLTTPRGELLGHGGYGSLLPVMIGTASVPESARLLAIEAKGTLLQDPRITAVMSINVVQGSGGANFIESVCKVIGREEPVDFNIVMPPKP